MEVNVVCKSNISLFSIRCEINDTVIVHRYRPPGSPGSGTIPKWISPGSASYVARPATSFIFVYITTVDPYVVIDLFYLFYF